MKKCMQARRVAHRLPSRHRYADLNDLPIPYVSFDRTGRIEEINLVAVQLLGRARNALIGSPFALCVHPDDSALFLNHLLHCRASNGRVETELRLNDASRRAPRVFLSSQAMASPAHDSAVLYQTAIVDLSTRKRAAAISPR